MEQLTINSFGTEVPVYFSKKKTTKGELSLVLLCMENGFLEPWCNVTMHPKGYKGNTDTGLVKNYSENEGLDDWLEENGIAKPTGQIFPTGRVILPEYKFDLSMVEKYSYHE